MRVKLPEKKQLAYMPSTAYICNELFAIFNMQFGLPFLIQACSRPDSSGTEAESELVSSLLKEQKKIPLTIREALFCWICGFLLQLFNGRMKMCECGEEVPRSIVLNSIVPWFISLEFCPPHEITSRNISGGEIPEYFPYIARHI